LLKESVKNTRNPELYEKRENIIRAEKSSKKTHRLDREQKVGQALQNALVDHVLDKIVRTGGGVGVQNLQGGTTRKKKEGARIRGKTRNATFRIQ